MAFSVSGGIVTQTGTDANLSGLGGVAGVTSNSFGVYTVYDMGTLALVVEGTLSINGTDGSDLETLAVGIAGATQANIDVRVASGGRLILGNRTSAGTSAYSSSRFFPSIVEKANIDFGEGNTKAFAGQPTLGNANSKGFLVVDGGGALEWYGCINSSGGIGFDGIANDLSSPLPIGNADVLIRDGIWDARGVTERSGVGDQFLYSYTDNLTVDGFTYISNETPTIGASLIILQQPLLLRNVVPVNTELAFTGSTSSANDLQLVIEDYPGIVGNSTGTDMTSATNNATNTNLVTFLNSALGSTLTFNTQDPGVSSIVSLQGVNGTFITSDNTPYEDSVVATQNKNNSITQDHVVTGAFDLGNILLTEWNPPGGTTPPAPTFNNPSNTDDDLWSFYAYSYLGQNRNRIDVLMRVIGGISLEFISPIDTDVSNQDRALVDSYSSIDNLDKLFDRSKSFKIANVGTPSLEVPIVISSGDFVDLGNLDLILDGATTSAYDANATTVTIGTDSTPVVTLIGVSEFESDSNSQSFSVDVPPAVLDGDQLVLILGAANATDSQYNTPAGWTEIQSETVVGGTPVTPPGINIYRKLANSEPVSYNITTSTSFSTGHVAQMLAYRNVDQTTPLDVSPVVTSGISGEPDPSAITTLNDESMILVIGFMDDGSQQDATPPTGYTQIGTTQTTFGAGAGE